MKLLRYVLSSIVCGISVWVVTYALFLLPQVFLAQHGSFRFRVQKASEGLFEPDKGLIVFVCICCWSISWGCILSVRQSQLPPWRCNVWIPALAATVSFALIFLGLFLRWPFRKIAPQAFSITFSVFTIALTMFLISIWLQQVRVTLQNGFKEVPGWLVRLRMRYRPNVSFQDTDARFSRPTMKSNLFRKLLMPLVARPAVLVAGVLGLVLAATSYFLPNRIGRTVVQPYVFDDGHTYETGGYPASIWIKSKPYLYSFNGIGPAGRFLPGRFLINWVFYTALVGSTGAIIRYGFRELDSIWD